MSDHELLAKVARLERNEVFLKAMGMETRLCTLAAIKEAQKTKSELHQAYSSILGALKPWQRGEISAEEACRRLMAQIAG